MKLSYHDTIKPTLHDNLYHCCISTFSEWKAFITLKENTLSHQLCYKFFLRISKVFSFSWQVGAGLVGNVCHKETGQPGVLFLCEPRYKISNKTKWKLSLVLPSFCTFQSFSDLEKYHFCLINYLFLFFNFILFYMM